MTFYFASVTSDNRSKDRQLWGRYYYKYNINKTMETKYQAIAFSIDGDFITEGEFDTVENCWDRINDWGSRWIFYPFTGVLKNKRVVSFCDALPELANKNIKTIQQDLLKNGEDYYNYL